MGNRSRKPSKKTKPFQFTPPIYWEVDWEEADWEYIYRKLMSDPRDQTKFLYGIPLTRID